MLHTAYYVLWHTYCILHTSMDTKTFPHLTQKGGAWIKQYLDEWTLIPNQTFPLHYPDFKPLDGKIAHKIRPEYDYFRAYPSECVSLGSKTTFSLRSPYANTQPVYTISYVRAILSQWLEFSYFNWLECVPPNTILGRMCDGPATCVNPRHFELGVKRTRTTKLFHEPIDTDTVVIPRDFSDWAYFEATLIAKVNEDLAAGDSRENIIKACEYLARNLGWTVDRPIPAAAGFTSIAEFVDSRLHPGTLPSKLSAPKMTEQEVRDILNPQADAEFQKRLAEIRAKKGGQ